MFFAAFPFFSILSPDPINNNPGMAGSIIPTQPKAINIIPVIFRLRKSAILFLAFISSSIFNTYCLNISVSSLFPAKKVYHYMEFTQ